MRSLKLFPAILTLLLIAALLGNSSSALAVQDQFIVSQQVTSADTTAPSIPQNVTATGVSTSQINVSWDASTDAVEVTGYQLFRNGTQIATSTSLAYSDTGLSESTTYAYNVTAFDAAGNISARSATTSAATTATAPPSTTTTVVSTSSGGGNAIPRLVRITVEEETESALVSWESNVPTRSILEWGEHEYEMSSLAERSYSVLHSTRLAGLTPNTEYNFRIFATNRDGEEVVLVEQSFRTRALADTVPPENVSGLTGTVVGNDGVLSWQNPASDFDHIRIVRKDGGYPSGPYDGALIYEGGAEEYRDKNSFLGFDQRYYAIFTYDASGNESSGAVVRVARPGTPEPKETFAPVMHPLTFGDLIFIQDGREVSYIGTDVPLKSSRPFEIRIPYERLPEHLKTVLVTLKDASNLGQTFSFLLRVNEDKTAYRAQISALPIEGGYPLVLSVFDYKERTISKTTGMLLIKATSTAETLEDQSLFGGLLGIVSRTSLFWLLVALFSLILILVYQEKRRRARQEGERQLEPRTQ